MKRFINEAIRTLRTVKAVRWALVEVGLQELDRPPPKPGEQRYDHRLRFLERPDGKGDQYFFLIKSLMKGIASGITKPWSSCPSFKIIGRIYDPCFRLDK